MPLRDATERDLPDIVTIYNATIPGRMVTADLAPVSVESRREWLQAHSPEAAPLWVLEEDGRLKGWLSFQRFHERPAYRATMELSVYVAEDCRRCGIGRRLIERAIEQAPSLGHHNLVGLIFGHNAPSLRLFEALGFSRWGQLPGVAELDGIERDLVIVGRRVGVSTTTPA